MRSKLNSRYQNKNRIIENFLTAVKKCFLSMDSRSYWPANAGQIETYFSDIIAIAIFNKFQKNPEKCKKALNNFRAFTLYASLYNTEIVGLKVSKVFDNYPSH